MAEPGGITLLSWPALRLPCTWHLGSWPPWQSVRQSPCRRQPRLWRWCLRRGLCRKPRSRHRQLQATTRPNRPRRHRRMRSRQRRRSRPRQTPRHHSLLRRPHRRPPSRHPRKRHLKLRLRPRPRLPRRSHPCLLLRPCPSSRCLRRLSQRPLTGGPRPFRLWRRPCHPRSRLRPGVQRRRSRRHMRRGSPRCLPCRLLHALLQPCPKS